MTPQHVISQLLASDAKKIQNSDLLKKIIIIAQLGRLQINGVAPDNKVALAHYLFDNERIMFDFSRLSEGKKEQLMHWLLGAHERHKERLYLSNIAVNEYRGFTADTRLSWWGRVKKWFQGYFINFWKIKDLDLNLEYQLLGINMCHGQHGVSIGFNQFLAPLSGTKYKASDDLPSEELGNTKRVIITDKLVDQLTSLDFNALNYEAICKNAHPLSVLVTDYETRYQAMRDYRRVQNFSTYEPWYIRVWNWFASWIPQKNNPPSRTNSSADSKLIPLYQNESTTIYQRQPTGQILVKEKRPDIENLVFCGGGAKIFAHVGVWKALNEWQIHPKKFAGSSAGAIMALLSYLGFSADKIAELLRHFKQENLVHFEIDRNGLSEPHALKTALDYAIALRVSEVVAQYNIPRPEGKLTFKTLDDLRQQCPGCGIGAELVVTATNKRQRKTRYFSLSKTPAMEVSEAVKVSASFPIVYKNTLINGDEYNDGGILSNFPTEAFHAETETDDSFLESEYGSNLRTLAVQFDNGTERSTMDRMLERVYKENFFMNWIYGILTGVTDPASAWEQDRMKLRKYAGQSIIVDVGDTSSTGFSVEEAQQINLIENGYQETKSYLKARYARKEGFPYRNREAMYATFSSLGELLGYCCYRGNRTMFDAVVDMIVHSKLPNRTALMKQVVELKALYFHADKEMQPPKIEPSHKTHKSNPGLFFSHDFQGAQTNGQQSKRDRMLLALFPIFLKLGPELVSNKADRYYLACACRSFTKDSLFSCLVHFSMIKDESHLILHILINLIKKLEQDPDDDAVFDQLKQVQDILYKSELPLSFEYYCRWDLDLRQGARVLKLIQEQSADLLELCSHLRRREEPLLELSPSPA
jgi:NTE family protein